VPLGGNRLGKFNEYLGRYHEKSVRQYALAQEAEKEEATPKKSGEMASKSFQ
jgi:hypothetical protein